MDYTSHCAAFRDEAILSNRNSHTYGHSAKMKKIDMFWYRKQRIQFRDTKGTNEEIDARTKNRSRASKHKSLYCDNNDSE